MKRVLAGVALVLAGAVALFFWARSPTGRRVILSQAVKLAQRRLQGELSIGRLEGGLLRDLVLHDVRIYDRDGQLAVELAEVRAHYRLSALLRRELQIRSLVVKGARVRGRLLRDRSFNLLALLHDSDGEGSFTLRIDSLRLEGELLFDGPPAIRGQLLVEGRARLGGGQAEAYLETLHFDSVAPLAARLQARGGLGWRPGAPALHDLRAELRSDAREIDRLEPAAHLKGPLTATLSADGDLVSGIEVELRVRPDRGELHAHAHAVMTPSGVRWQASAQADLDPASFHRRAPHGRFTLAATGAGENGRGTVELRELALESGRNHARAFGRVKLGAKLAARLELTAHSPDLSQLGWPGLGGALEAHAQLSVTRAHTHMEATLEGQRLRLGAAHLSQLELHAHTDHRSGQRQSWEVVLDELRVGKGWQTSEPGRLHVDPTSVSAELSLHHAEQTLQLQGKLTRKSGAIEASGRAKAGAVDVNAEAAWDGEQLTAELHAAEKSGGELRLHARIPRDAAAPLSLSLSAHAFQIALAELGQLRRFDGTLNADLRAKGPRAHPLLSGSAKLDGGTLAIAADPRPYENLTVDLAAKDGWIELRRLEASAGGGKLTAHGNARVDGLRLQSLDVAAEAARFPVVAGNLDAWIDAAAELHGTRTGDRLTGTLTVTRGGAHLPERMQGGRPLQPLGPLEDVHFSDEPERSRAMPSLNAEVVAHIPGPFEVRSPEVEADVRGQFDILLSDGELRLYGHGETTWGRLELFGRRYELEHARVDFDGSADPAVDVRLTRVVTGTTIVVEVQGTAKSPKLVLSSDPPLYDSTQIIGILLSGDPASPGLPESSRGALAATQDTLASAVSNLLVRNLTDQLMPGLPLQLHVESGGTTRLELGHQLTDRVHLRYTHAFGATGSGIHQVNANEASVEVRFRRRASLTLRYGDAGVGVLDLTWMLRF